MWGATFPMEGLGWPDCGGGGVCTAEQLRAGREGGRCGIPWSPLFGYPRGVPPRPALLLPSGPPWLQPSSSRPGPRAPLALLVPKLPRPLPGANGPPSPRRAAAPPFSAPSLATARRRDPHPLRQAGKCSPALGSPRAGTPLIAHPPTHLQPCTPRTWDALGDVGNWR